MSRLARLAVVSILALATIPASTVDAQTKKSKFKSDLQDKEKNSAKPGKKETTKTKKTSSRKRKTVGKDLPLLEQALVEHALSADEVDKLIDKNITLLMNDGKRIESVKVLKFVKGKDPARVRTIVSEGEGTSEKTKTKSYNLKSVFRIEVDKQVYDVRMIPSQKAYALIDGERRTKAIKAQLEAAGYKLWEPFSAEKQERYVEEGKKFLEEVKGHFTGINLQLHESKYFLFMTDMPLNDIGPYIVHLDAMNERLGEAFGFAPGENVWRGKAIIVTFIDRVNFEEFESHFMKAPSVPGNVLARCHPDENGRVIVGGVRGDDPVDFGAVLVHETAHGYVHRYQSNKPIPRWLNEGIADWVAGAAIPNSGLIKNHVDSGAQHVRATGSLGGMFSNQVPEAWQYGVAATIVNLLIQHDPDAFRLFFDGIKDGLLWEDSLQRAYGASRADLIALYANSIGMDELEP